MNKVPLGVEDYLDAQNYFYIDKTLLIKDLIENYIGKSLLITRPRRFGKSLNLSMLEYFFSNKHNSSYAFNDKKISSYREICDAFLNKYPVIRINFKNIMAISYESLYNQIIDTISDLYRKYTELFSYDGLFDIEKEELLNVANKKYSDPYQYVNSINHLCNYLFRLYKKKVIILIDEYDTPIQVSYDNNFYDNAVNLFKSLYSSTLKGNEYMLFSVVTGVLEIGKESLFSGLNNLSVSTIADNSLINHFGFTEEEIKYILKNYNLNDKFNELNSWYGGYGTVEINIFNPWSILSYIENKEYSYYWVNTSTNTLLNKLITTSLEKSSNNIEIFASFLNNAKLPIIFNPKISYRDIDNNLDSILSFLVQIGYLTVKKIGADYFVFIPNKEIAHVFKNEVIGVNSPKETLIIASSLKNAFLTSSSEQIKEILEKYILSSFSYYDLKDEKSYQVLITGILATLFDEFIVKSEVNSQKGRCDIMISPKNGNELGIIIELKKYNNKNSKNKLITFSLKAIEQIKEKRYFMELQNRDIKRIILYGMAFDENNLEISYEEI